MNRYMTHFLQTPDAAVTTGLVAQCILGRMQTRFPKGLITEWYPYADKIGPSWVDALPVLGKLDNTVRQTGLEPNFSFTALDPTKGVKDSVIRWPEVRLKAKDRSADRATLLPQEASGSHYYAARETDANLPQVHAPIDGKEKTECEKL